MKAHAAHMCGRDMPLKGELEVHIEGMFVWTHLVYIISIASPPSSLTFTLPPHLHSSLLWGQNPRFMFFYMYDSYHSRYVYFQWDAMAGLRYKLVSSGSCSKWILVIELQWCNQSALSETQKQLKWNVYCPGCTLRWRCWPHRQMRVLQGKLHVGTSDDVQASFLLRWSNALAKSNSRKKGFISAHNLRLQSVIAGKSRQGLQEASHTIRAVKNKEKQKQPCFHACSFMLDLLSPNLTQLRNPCLWSDAAHSELGSFLIK